MVDTSRTVTLEDFYTRSMDKLLAPIIYLTILMILGIPGNLFALIIYRHKYSRTVYRTIIWNLALVDFAFSTLTFPFNIGRLVRYYTFYEVWVCKTFTTIIIFFVLYSSHLLIVLAIHRYRQVCHPHKTQINNTNVRYWIIGGFFLAVVLDIPEAIFQPIDHINLEDNITGYVCPVTFNTNIYGEIYNWFLTVLYIIYALILFVLYILIGRRMYTQRQRQQQSVSSPGQTDNDDLATKLTKIAITVSFVFALSYLPLFVLKAIRSKFKIDEECLSDPIFAVLKIFERSYSFNHVANPFIYAYFDNRFREQIRVLITKMLCSTRFRSPDVNDRTEAMMRNTRGTL